MRKCEPAGSKTSTSIPVSVLVGITDRITPTSLHVLVLKDN